MNPTSSTSGSRTRPVAPIRWLAALGAAVIYPAGSTLAMLGGGTWLLGRSVRGILGGLFVPGETLRKAALLTQMVRVGVRAIPIVILVQATIGMILPLQMFPELDRFGQADQIATINTIAAFRELGPLMTAVVLSGFAGASIAAELGTMVTAEEIEALHAMALNPVRFLVVPRLLATILMTIMLTVIADMVMIVGGWLTALRLGLDSDMYFLLTREAVTMTAFLTGLIKAAVFGLLVGLIACHLGLAVKPWQGSDGVGRATTCTVVYSIVAIIVADAVFTIIFYTWGLFT